MKEKSKKKVTLREGIKRMGRVKKEIRKVNTGNVLYVQE
jgi:hypothetical protein